MQDNKPPYDATIENIKLLCRELRDVSEADHDELEDSVDDLQGSTFARNLEAAQKLGLFEEEDGLYSPTTNGKKLGYGLNEDEEDEFFRELIREYEFYNDLLRIVGEDLTEKGGEQYLVRNNIQSAIGINFNFGVGDRTLESAAGFFLKVLEAAGIGEYKRGTGDYPGRLVVNDDYSGFLADVVGDAATEDEAENENQAEPPTDSQNSPRQEDGQKQEEQEPIEETADIYFEDSIQADEAKAVAVKINIDISSSDWGSSDVIDLIKALQSEDSS